MTPELLISLLALIVVAVGLMWWLKRREREYSYADRADKIEQALRDRVDISLVYWSKSKRKFVRKLVTPESLTGLVLQAFDAERNTSRTFKITRIKEITLVTDPSHFNPELLESPTSPVAWLIVPLLVALAVVLVLLQHSRRPLPTDSSDEFTPGEIPEIATNQADSIVPLASTNQPELTARAEDAQAAISAFNAATRFQPEPLNAAGYLLRAQSRFSQRDYQAAIMDCTKSVELSPYSPQAYWMRAYAEIASGDFKAAIDDASKSIDLNPNLYQPYFVRGTARQYQNDFEGALADLAKAIELNPKDAAPVNARAWARYRQGDRAGAIENATKALNLDPRNADAYDTRGWAKLASGDKDGAARDCRMAVEFGGETPAALSSQGLLRFMAGDFDAAVADWKKAIAIMPYMKADLEPWIIKAQQANTNTPSQ